MGTHDLIPSRFLSLHSVYSVHSVVRMFLNHGLHGMHGFWNVDTAFGLYPLQTDHLLPGYLFYFCRSFNFHSLDKSTTIPSLAKRDIESINFPLPPLAEQKRIVAKIEELFSELDAGEESLRRARRQLRVYRQSLLKQAFTGQLVPQNPTDEPASVLLERIWKERQAHVIRIVEEKNNP